jgi:hypothetical protein
LQGHKIATPNLEEAATLLKPLIEEAGVNQTETQAVESSATAKKPFVEPEITVPVDVLEATTFFQSATSGATN